MDDLTRLLDQDPSALERELLLSARAEHPRGDGLQKTLVAVGVAAGVTATAGAATGGVVATVSKHTALALVAKWAAIGAVGGTLVVGTVETIHSGGPAQPVIVLAPAPEKRAAPARVVTAAKKAVKPAPLDEVDEIDVAEVPVAPSAAAAPPSRPALAPQPEPPASPPALASAAPAPALRDPLILTSEVALIDRIRTELAAQRADEAIALIGVYRGQFPKGALGPEATILHVRALLYKGDRQGAIALGQRLLEADPNGPYAAKIRAMLGGDKP
jgi:hypothetical protein